MRQLIKQSGFFLATAFVPFKSHDRHEPIDLILDTGAVMTLVDTVLIDYLGYSARQDGIKRSTLDGASGRSVGYVIRLPRFRCLGFDVRDFEIACHDMNTRTGVSGLLGMNFLQHFRIDMNYQSGQIYKIEQIVSPR